jgi:hypothetical protein
MGLRVAICDEALRVAECGWCQKEIIKQCEVLSTLHPLERKQFPGEQLSAPQFRNMTQPRVTLERHSSAVIIDPTRDVMLRL